YPPLPARSDRPRLRQHRGGALRARSNRRARHRAVAQRRRRQPGGHREASRHRVRRAETMTSRAIVLVAVALGAAGCMVGPDYRRPDVATPPSFGELAPTAPPAGRSDAVAGGTPTAWWTTFDDQLLMSLIQRTVQSNLTLQQAEARVREARASRRIAAADLWPQVEASGSYTRERTSKNGLSVGGSGRVFNLFQAGFDANWEVDVFGGNRRAVEAADASVEAAEDDRNAVLVSLMGEVGLEYVTYRSLQQRVALANQNLAAQQGTLDLTRRLFNAGLAPEIDVQRAAAQVATTASTIPLLDQQAAQAMHVLSVLLGQPPMTLQQELTPGSQQELLAAYEGVVLQAFQDVEDALVAFSHEQATRDQLEDAVRANRRAAELARNLYAQGLTDFLTVLVAEESLFTSQDTLAQTQRDVALQLVALYKAVGGGWEAAPPMREASANGS